MVLQKDLGATWAEVGGALQGSRPSPLGFCLGLSGACPLGELRAGRPRGAHRTRAALEEEGKDRSRERSVGVALVTLSGSPVACEGEVPLPSCFRSEFRIPGAAMVPRTLASVTSDFLRGRSGVSSWCTWTLSASLVSVPAGCRTGRCGPGAGHQLCALFSERHLCPLGAGEC